MADNEVTYKVRADIVTSGEERLEFVNDSLKKINESERNASNPISKPNLEQEQNKNQPEQKNYSDETDKYLKSVDSVAKGFSLLAKSIESPITLLGMLRDGLYNAAKATAKKADKLQLSKKDKTDKSEHKKPEDERLNPTNEKKLTEQQLTISPELKKALGKTNKPERKKPEDERLNQTNEQKTSMLPQSNSNKGKSNEKPILSDMLGDVAKGLGSFGAALAIGIAVVTSIDKAFKKMNEAALAAGERLANLQTTGNVAGARLDEWENSWAGIFAGAIPIVGELMKRQMVNDVAAWTAYQPFAKLIPGLLDYKYSTGLQGSGADVANKVTEQTGLETGYDFATRFKILGEMSTYTGKDNDAQYTHELLRNSRVLGLDPNTLVDLVGNAVRYKTDTFTENDNEIMTSIEKTAMDTDLDRSRYKELISGIDNIIKKQLAAGVPVSVSNVADVASVLGQAGNVWKGEQSLQVQMSMNERLMNAGNLSSDEDVAMYQYTKGNGQSYHDWRLAADKGFDTEMLGRFSERFLNEAGADTTTANIRLTNLFNVSYTQADELRQLMEKIRSGNLKNTERDEATKQFNDKMSEIKESQRPEELTYLEKINTVMETTSQKVSNQLDSILDILMDSTKREIDKDYEEANKASKESYEKEFDISKDFFQQNAREKVQENGGNWSDVQNVIDYEYLQKRIFLDADNDHNGILDKNEKDQAFDKLDATLEALTDYLVKRSTADKGSQEALLQQLIDKIGEGIIIQ